MCYSTAGGVVWTQAFLHPDSARGWKSVCDCFSLLSSLSAVWSRSLQSVSDHAKDCFLLSAWLLALFFSVASCNDVGLAVFLKMGFHPIVAEVFVRSGFGRFGSPVGILTRARGQETVGPVSPQGKKRHQEPPNLKWREHCEPWTRGLFNHFH